MSEVDLNMKRKKLMSVLIVAVFVISSLAILATPATAQDQGEYVNEIELVVRTSENTAMGDTAEGDIDVFIQGVTGKRYEGISREWKSKLGTWRSVGGYNNFLLNPAYNRTLDLPITNVGGEWQFNAFGIQKVRFAANWMIDRQFMVNDIYAGYGSARFTPMGQEDPGYDEYFRPIVEDELGMTASGDMGKAKDMVDEAMNNVKDKFEADGNHGEVRKDGGTWQYKAPGGSFEDITLKVVMRIEDERQLEGNYFADQLEEVGFAVERLPRERASAMDLTFYANPADQTYHVYTGGWLASVAAKFQYWSVPQMYSSYYPYMPGGFGGPTFWQYSNESLYPIAEDLMTGRLEDTDEYWEKNQEGMRIGLRESVRVFTISSFDYYVYDASSVVTAASNVVTGYDSVFTPRTIKTTDGKMMAAQFSSEGALYMDNWNDIAGLGDTYGMAQRDMASDYAVMYHPSEGVPMEMRASYTTETGISYDDDGNLVMGITVPETALTFNTETMEWEEVGSGVKAATAATYDWTDGGNHSIGTWHDGHEMTERDILASWAFHKDLAYDDGEGDLRYVDPYSNSNKPWYDSVYGVEWGEEDGVFTVYGDYTFPVDEMIGNYYSSSPSKPWQILEATNHVVQGTDLSASNEDYSWENVGDKLWVHFLSDTQCQDFVDTMDNMVSEGYIPEYMKEENGCPFPITASEMESDINAITSFFDDYEHLWDSNGPFVITSSDKQAMRVTLDRFTQEDGYPLPDNYWADKLRTVTFEFGTIESPSIVDVGDMIDITMAARIRESYPTTSVSPADSGEVTVELINEAGETVKSVEGTLATAGTFTASIDTTDVEAGSYTLKFSGELVGTVAPSVRQKTILIKGEAGPAGEISVEDLTVEPEEGKKPLEVTITAEVSNPTEVDQDWELTVDGEVVDSGTLAPGENTTVSFTEEYKDVGDYLVALGDQDVTFTVKGEDQPGFTFALLAVSAAVALVIYRRKRL